MDESKRSGLNTRNALNDLTLTPSICITANNDENKLYTNILLNGNLGLTKQNRILPYHDNCKVENIPCVP